MPESQEPPKKTGRPSDYTDALADAICERIIQGESMASICQDEDMPSESMVYRWLGAQQYFRERLAGAREMQADRMAAEILLIADNGAHDTMTVIKGKTVLELPDTEYMMRSKLRVDARFKLMALLAPKKYGTKQLDITTGGDKLTGIQINDIGG